MRARHLATVCFAVAGALLIGSVPATGTTGLASVRAATATDPLVADSLTALDSLMASANCTLSDAADNDTTNGIDLPYTFCDDGLVPSGGGSKGIPVPVAYEANAKGNDWSGLPAPADQTQTAKDDSADDLQPESGNRITLDVDISLPAGPAPTGGYPVIGLMHGCCGGSKASWESKTIDATNESWHDNNSWYASQGYIVITYTARGFRNSNDQGSTGTTQLDSRRYEINDFQYLVGLLADDDADHRAGGIQPAFGINPRKIGAIGGSYGGGWTWLALTDPTWKSPEHRIPVKLAAAVPKYGWTDLVESLVPSGHYLDQDPNAPGHTVIAPSQTSTALSGHPIGVEKASTVTGLYGTGNNMASSHTTFPSYLNTTYQRLQQGEPYDGDPTLTAALNSFLADRSAYFQNSFWKRVHHGLRVPIFAAATWTDPLFPTMESMRFYNKLKKLAPTYPITVYLGDYEHLYAQNKPKEWDSLCGDDHHVCAVKDYTAPDGSIHLNKATGQVRAGLNARIDSFLNYYLQGKGRKPAANVSATTTICASNASKTYPQDEPGIEYQAPTWRKLAPHISKFSWTDGFVSNAQVDMNAAQSDPVVRSQSSDKCFTTSQTNPQGDGVTTLTSDAISADFTMMGVPWVQVKYDTADTDYWLAARLYDQQPGGSMTLVTRGICKVDKTSDKNVDCSTFDLWGNGWTFPKGDRIVVELTQSDSPTFRKDNNSPTNMTVNSASLSIPTTKNSLKHDFRG